MLDEWIQYLGGLKPFEIKSSFGYRHVVEMRSTVIADRLREMLDGQIVDVLSELMDSIERLESQIVLEEKGILKATRVEHFILFNKILEESAAIIQNCRYIAQLDVLLNFARIQRDRHYIRPTLNCSGRSTIVAGRHPVVELALQEEGRQFVANDCSVGQDELIWLLTGPNMGGKSTFLRQNAIITIMAQMGSFVPAAAATLSILGSSDNLSNSQSTFMVEMTETAAILHNATERSLVLMDEVGRGTATLDGCAIAYATLHHLYHVNKCRTIFATHYHELADMVTGNCSRHDSVVMNSQRWQGQEPLAHVRCYQTTMEPQPDGTFVYMHQVLPGVCRQSNGIYVAKLAGLPQSAIDMSQKMLQTLQANAYS
ncbi:DNA mismatch repair ATPase msh1 [Podila epigama]|nr:DNA mismatch repair ATPase msh1 [Podila epigama]